MSIHKFRVKRVPNEIMQKEIIVPTAPNKLMVVKFLKKCFFFTWNLVKTQYNDTIKHPFPRTRINTSTHEHTTTYSSNFGTAKLQPYPALNIIGGKRYMKKSSSSNSKILELTPFVASNRIVPVPKPCHQTINLKSLKTT